MAHEVHIAAGASAGIIRTPAFVNASAGAPYVGANGAWLAGPDAALMGSANNSDVPTTVLLALSSPAYDAATQVTCLGWRICMHAHVFPL
jgi:hypothetical protein